MTLAQDTRLFTLENEAGLRIAVMDFDYATVQTASSALFGTNVDVGKGMDDVHDHWAATHEVQWLRSSRAHSLTLAGRQHDRRNNAQQSRTPVPAAHVRSTKTLPRSSSRGRRPRFGVRRL